VISEEEARTRILENVAAWPQRTVPLADALGCFAAKDYFARLPLPVFDNSAMDGYAVIASECKRGRRLRVIGEQPAGPDRKLRMASGEAVRIFTGAALPIGADAVIMQEDVTQEGEQIVANADVDAGEFVRRRGCDLAEGQKILAKGEKIRAGTLGLLASQGFSHVEVGSQAKAAIVSTGDELVAPGARISPGQIYESNSALLQGLLLGVGAAVESLEPCRDERQGLRAAIERGIKNHLLIITGGVSVGEHDLVQEVLNALGAQIDIWRVAVKPGKPFLFARLDDCAVFGLPGNPVSVFVTFLQFVRPAILKMMGASSLLLAEFPARLAVNLTNEGERPHYVRGRLDHGEFIPVGRQESHALFGLSQANALLRLAVGQSFRAGDVVGVQVWD
jgi:molybdopterin molybdotransferase